MGETIAVGESIDKIDNFVSGETAHAAINFRSTEIYVTHKPLVRHDGLALGVCDLGDISIGTASCRG